jgi:hypothetical protein
LNRRFVKLGFFLLLVFSAANPASVSASPIANRLFVETVQLIQSADATLNEDEKLERLGNALSKLNRIIDKHPTSDLAVRLISGQEIGSVSLALVSAAVKDLKEKKLVKNCATAPSASCVLLLARIEAEKIEDDFFRSLGLSFIAGVQADIGDTEAAIPAFDAIVC